MAKRKCEHKKPASSEREPPPRDPRLMDRDMANLQKILSEHEFCSLDEANTFLQKLIVENDGRIPTQAAETPAERAQELIYQAHESNGRKRVRLARKALEVYPDCADAYVLLAEEDAPTDAEARELYEQAVAAAERTLGPEYFTDPELVGHFWGVLETRTYMRARGGLACHLWEMGEQECAVEHAAELLRLNPSENQGMRYHLVGWLVTVGRDREARRLLHDYAQDPMAVWPYMRALLAFRKHGDTRKAREALCKAFERNSFVPIILMASDKPPEEPDFYGVGDENEAIVTIYQIIEAWVATPGAVEWLASVCAEAFEEDEDS